MLLLDNLIHLLELSNRRFNLKPPALELLNIRLHILVGLKQKVDEETRSIETDTDVFTKKEIHKLSNDISVQSGVEPIYPEDDEEITKLNLKDAFKPRKLKKPSRSKVSKSAQKCRKSKSKRSPKPRRR